jgi:hypothetical protein
MLYLFGTGSFKYNFKAAKVGYTNNKKERETAYKLHNPLGEFIAWREGDKALEEKLHMRLIDYKQDFLDEWFYYDEDVLKIFNLPENEIDEWLWTNRYRVFYDGYFLVAPGTLKRKIFDSLRRQYDPNSPVLDEKTLSIYKDDLL